MQLEQVIEFHINKAADGFQSLQSEALAGKQSFDIGLAHPQLAGNIGVGKSPRFKGLFQRGDHGTTLSHRVLPLAKSTISIL